MHWTAGVLRRFGGMATFTQHVTFTFPSFTETDTHYAEAWQTTR
jgi:hypothetical protein